MWIKNLLLRLVPRRILIDISFHNFHNAITACYISDKQLKIRRVNSRLLEMFKLSKEQLKGASVADIFSHIGLSEEFKEDFEYELRKQGFVKIPELKATIEGEERYYSLFSTYTKDIHLPFLSGLQGQFIDRTQEVLLRKETERLSSDLAKKQEEVHEKNQHLEELATKLAKYLSPQVYSSIFTGEKQVSISFERKRLTIFFSDIKDFTLTTDSMESEDLAQLLNHYLDSMTQIALKYGGTIDKYIGDAILIFFGDPETHGDREDASRCVKMALEMRNLMSELRGQWYASGISTPLHIRMGINTGYCTVGNFGSEVRLDYTIIGGQVNLASRLEHTAETDTILISHETYGLINDKIYCELIGEINVKGIAHPIKTYRVIDYFDKITTEQKVVEKKLEGFRLCLDLANVKQQEDIRLILKDALKLLDK